MAPERPGPEDEPVPALSASDSLRISATLFSIQMKVGDGASEDHLVSEDNDLTSLTWLQDKNLLKGISLQTNVTEIQESVICEYIEESTSERDSSCSSVNPASPASPPTPLPVIRNKHPHHIPYDPQVHTSSKPPYSFSCLIFMAIEESPNKALPVKEIYGWILEHFPFYKKAPTGWKNSVRHNLSLNKCFKKVEKAPNLGKGSLWMVDPPYRSTLLQALQKAPYHPCTSLDKASNSSFPRVSPSKELDPALIPVLARRLAGVEDSDPLDDVDAAAAMLELKHGPALRRDEYHQRLSAPFLHAAKRIKTELSEAMLTTLSPSGDHTYSSAEPSNSIVNVDISSWMSQILDMEEQRKIAEGADALLNLAGISTSNTPVTTFKNRWKDGGLTTENNNVIENNCYEFEPAIKSKRKPSSSKDLGSYKR